MHGNHWTKQGIKYGKDCVPIWPINKIIKCKCGNNVGQLAFHARFVRHTLNLSDLGWICAECLDKERAKRRS